MPPNKWWQFWQDNMFPLERKIKKSLKEIQMICWAEVQHASVVVCWCFFCHRKTRWTGGAMLTGTFSLLAYTTAQLLYKDADRWIFRSSGICCFPNFSSLFCASNFFFSFILHSQTISAFLPLFISCFLPPFTSALLFLS